MKLGLAAPAALVDLGGLAELQGHQRVRRHGEDRRDDHARRGGGVQGSGASDSGAGGTGRPASATARCATAARSAAAWPTTTRRPTTRRPCWALGATIHTDKRTIAADDFFKGLYQTALDDGEIITAVSFPVPEKAGWQKFKQPASRFALVGVFVSQGQAAACAWRSPAPGPGVFRAKALEDKLAANWSGSACDGVEDRRRRA